jgi:ceramide glucosyltransferase
MLFSRDSFLRKAGWDELGSSLSDDFMLGQVLQPVRLGSTTLETVADAADWPAAFAHYLRWKKTVCWCRPIGFAAQILILPLLGWIGFVAVHPANPRAWVGLIGMMQADVFFAFLICREVGCRINRRSSVAGPFLDFMLAARTGSMEGEIVGPTQSAG